jgi:inosine-uridine nucleoside N-ribohydrolase
MTLVPLDATHHGGVVTLEDCKQLRALGTPAAEAAAIFAERRAGAYADRQDDPAAFIR